MPVSRRQFLKIAGGAAVAAGAGYAISDVVGSPPPARSALAKPPPSVAASSDSYPYHTRANFHPQPITVTVPARDTAPGLILLTASKMDGYQHGPMLVDNAGRHVWFLPTSKGTTNLQMQRYRGKPVLTWWEGEIVKPGYGEGDYVIVDTSYEEVKRVQGGNGLKGDLHEFVLTPQGTALFTAYQIEKVDLSSVGGASNARLLSAFMQEVDVATGKVLFEWEAAKHVALSESYVKAPTKTNALYDFFHINSICLDTDGNYLVSGRHTWAVYKIDRSSGSIIWRLNGKKSDFTMGPKTKFSWQHHVRRHAGDVLTIFDDGAGIYNTEKESRGLKLALDTSSMQASFVQEYLPKPNMLVTSQGSVEVMPNGNVFVGWGSEPYYSEYAADGTLLYDARLPKKSHSYRAFRADWTGRPTKPPAIAAKRASTEHLLVYASWNGATDVAHWEVLTGPSKHSLDAVARASRAGFETAIEVKTRDRYVAVRARDDNDRVLGHSEVLKV